MLPTSMAFRFPVQLIKPPCRDINQPTGITLGDGDTIIQGALRFVLYRAYSTIQTCLCSIAETGSESPASSVPC